MKILHVLNHSIPMHSGYTFRTQSLSNAQRAMGWTTDHVTGTRHTAPCGAEELVEGLHFWRTPQDPTWRSRLSVVRDWNVVRTLRDRLREVVPASKPDLLHVHSPVLGGMAALPVARAVGIPVAYEVRAFWEDAAADQGVSGRGRPRYEATRWLETRLFRQVDAIFTICEGLKSDIVDRGIPAEKITIIPNGVDVDRFPLLDERDEELEQSLGLVGKTVLGFIGSLFTFEGVPLVLDAVSFLRGRYPDLRLLVVGGGEDAERIAKQVRRLGLEDQLLLIGRVPHDQVRRYYSLCDAMVYARHSIRLTELVTPLKPLEAMAQGKLVIASDVGGHRELIRPNETGILFDPGSADALACAITTALESRAEWPAIRKAARLFVETERSWAESASRYAPVFSRLVGAMP